MDARVAAKLARHAREGVVYPNAAAAASRIQTKLARHQATGKVQGEEAATAEAKPAEKKVGKERAGASAKSGG